MKLVRKHFRAWLEAQRAGTTVGVPGDACDCPLANYLISMGGTHVHVLPNSGAQTGTFFPTGIENDDIPLPKWANEFALAVDNTGSDARITAERALARLDDG